MKPFRAVAAAAFLLPMAAHAQIAAEPFSYGPVQVRGAAEGPQPDVDADYPGSGWDDTSAETRDANQTARASSFGGAARTTPVTTVTVSTGWSGGNPNYAGHTSYVRRTATPNALETGSAAMPRLDAPNIDVTGVARAVRVPRDRTTGHFITSVVMNGVRIPVIIDTGATGTILSPEAARATGALRDVTHAQYAAGIGGVTALNVTRIRSFAIGGRDIGGFEALIGREGIPYTLLGQTELRRLGRIVIDDDVLTITPRDPRVATR